jgi:hypothetical protein
MRQLAARSAQELAFFRDPKGPMHHLQLIEQRRYHQIEVNWSEGMDPLQRVRAISAGAADFSKMTDRDIQAADRALRLQVMPPGVSQVDLRLAAQFEKTRLSRTGPMPGSRNSSSPLISASRQLPSAAHRRNSWRRSSKAQRPMSPQHCAKANHRRRPPRNQKTASAENERPGPRA